MYECWQGGNQQTHGRSMELQYGTTTQIFRGANIRGRKLRGIKVLIRVSSDF